jgi:hypothetical protein
MSRRARRRALEREREVQREREREREAPKRPSRSELKNAEARARLVPLAEGERPRAVTVAALVALALALTEVGFAAAGYEVRGSKAAWPGVALFTLLLLAMAWGLWNARYWAVLGMQALLGLAMVLFGLLLAIASNLQAVLISLAVIVPAGALFWFLVKAMARIQMPERR